MKIYLKTLKKQIRIKVSFNYKRICEEDTFVEKLVWQISIKGRISIER